MPNRETLLLSGRDIKKAVDMRQALDIALKAFSAHGRNAVQMPPKVYIHLEKYHGDFRAMPAYVEDIDACGIKWVNVHPCNKVYDLPAVMALIILNDPKTGFPLAVMDGTYITNLRTGAAGGIAAQYLARKGSSRVGFVGCGAQASFQLMALQKLFRIKEVSAYDCESAHAKRFIRYAGSLGIPANRAASIETCVRKKDIVITTTPSRKPVVRAAWVSPGTHINAIGADAKGKQELDADILKRARIIVDDIAQAIHSGEINVPLSKKQLLSKDIHATLGQIVNGSKKGRTSDAQITVFDSTGLAIQDMAVAAYVYKRLTTRGSPTRTISFL